MKKAKIDETVAIEKASYVAFCSYRGVHLLPFTDPQSRVKFRGNKKAVERALAELASNPEVPLLDYLNRLDAVRSLIFTLKNNGTSRGGNGKPSM